MVPAALTPLHLRLTRDADEPVSKLRHSVHSPPQRGASKEDSPPIGGAPQREQPALQGWKEEKAEGGTAFMCILGAPNTRAGPDYEGGKDLSL